MAGLLLAGLPVAGEAMAAPMAPSADAVDAAVTLRRVDYRPYYHCHGPKRCHGKGNYYKYGQGGSSYEPFKYGCRYGCGYNNGWNSPSSRFDYTGRRYYGKHRRHRH
jgi:hypothetical protein